jgi:hypothetical protein
MDQTHERCDRLHRKQSNLGYKHAVAAEKAFCSEYQFTRISRLSPEPASEYIPPQEAHFSRIQLQRCTAGVIEIANEYRYHLRIR